MVLGSLGLWGQGYEQNHWQHMQIKNLMSQIPVKGPFGSMALFTKSQVFDLVPLQYHCNDQNLELDLWQHQLGLGAATPSTSTLGRPTSVPDSEQSGGGSMASVRAPMQSIVCPVCLPPRPHHAHTFKPRCPGVKSTTFKPSGLP